MAILLTGAQRARRFHIKWAYAILLVFVAAVYLFLSTQTLRTFTGQGVINYSSKAVEEVANPFSRIILMAQFNTDSIPKESVWGWVQTMTPYFGKVIVRGEFWNQTVVEEYRSVGLDVRLSDGSLRRGTAGFFTPLNNLKHALLDYQNDTDQFDGVLYMHDDAIPNLPILAQRLHTHQQRRTTIVGTDIGKPSMRHGHKDHSYEDPRVDPDPNTTDPMWYQSRGSFSYRIYPFNKTHPFTDYAGGNASKSAYVLDKALDSWGMRTHRDGRCLFGQFELAMDLNASQYYEGSPENPYMLFPSYTQADLLYFPLATAQPFAHLATLLEKHGVWIECAFATIVDQLRRQQEGLQVQVVRLCTSWGGKRGKIGMVHKCLHESSPTYHGFYHPVKPGRFFADWQQMVERFNSKLLQNDTQVQVNNATR